MLKVESYSLEYGSNLILDNISFSLEKGKVLGILGPADAVKLP